MLLDHVNRPSALVLRRMIGEDGTRKEQGAEEVQRI